MGDHANLIDHLGRSQAALPIISKVTIIKVERITISVIRGRCRIDCRILIKRVGRVGGQRGARSGGPAGSETVAHCIVGKGITAERSIVTRRDLVDGIVTIGFRTGLRG